MLHHHLPPIVYFLHTCILLEIVWTTRLDWILPTGGLNRVTMYRKKTFYLWYPENLFSGSYITCGAAVPVSVSYFTELCGSALKPSRHWSVWSAQLRDVGKGVWQVHGRCRHSLCQRDFWRLVWHKAVWTTYQRFSPSRVFFFPLLSIAPLFTFFSLLYPSLFICLVPRCFASVSGLASSLSYFSLGLVVSSFHSRPLSRRFFLCRSLSASRSIWKCPVRGDTLSEVVWRKRCVWELYQYRTKPPSQLFCPVMNHCD